MPNPRLAGRYAKSLIGLAIERNQLENVYNDILYLQMVVKGSRDFVNLLASPIIKPSKKQAILDAVTKSGNLSELTLGFARLLVTKGRESKLPEIITAFVEQYNAGKGLQILKLTTAIPVSEELKQEIISKVQRQSVFKNIEIRTEIQEDIIGGFKLELDNMLVDATIAYDLNKIKKQFMNNEFVHKIK